MCRNKFTHVIACVFDRDVPVDGRVPLRHGWKCGDRALLQLPEPHQDEAALQPHSRASRSAHENEVFWGRGGGLRL